MKRRLGLIICVVLLIGCSVINFYNVPTHSSVYSDLDKENWEYFKDNFLFGNGVNRYNEPIRIELRGDYKSKDSVFVMDFISKLNKIMESQKICLVVTDGNFILDFKNDLISQRRTNRQQYWYYSIFSKKNQSRVIYVNKDMDDSSRIRRIQSELVRGLVTPRRQYVDNQFIAKESIFSSTPINWTEFSDLDRFILSKAYANDYQFLIDIVFPHISWEHNEEKGYPFYLALVVALLLLWYFVRKHFFFSDPIIISQYLKNGLLIISVYIVFYAIKSFGGFYLRSYFLWYFLTLGFIFLKGIIAIPIVWWIEHELLAKLPVSMKMISLFLSWWLVVGIIYTPDLMVDPNKMMGGLRNTIFIFSIVLLRVAIWFVNYKTRQTIRQKDLELSNLEKLKQQAELQALHSRINPHFLYNSLNSIASLAHEDANKTEQMALSLSDFCRSAINKQNKDSATIAEEVALIRNYLEIEKVRFGDRLNYKMDIEASLETQEIPRFLLQPLVENAIKHGVAQITTQGFIRIEVVFDNDRIVLKVYDNGPDFPDELITGYGLQSLHDKLQIIYKDAAHLNWQNSPEKCICVTLPFKSQFASYE